MVSDDVKWPWWWGWSPIHASHRASLLRKDPAYYAAGLQVASEYARHGYVWPTRVPEALRGAAQPPLEDICAPVQGMRKQPKKRKADA